jgi:hypothetical protein
VSDLRITLAELGILVVAVLVALAGSYWPLKIPEIKQYFLRVADEEPECRSERVIGELSRARGSAGKTDRPIAMMIERRYAAEFEPQRTLRQDLPVRVARDLWLREALTHEQTIAAYCAGGDAWGRRRNLPNVARLVGLASLSATTDTQLRALARTYVACMKSNAEDDRIRAYYKRELAGDGRPSCWNL